MKKELHLPGEVDDDGEFIWYALHCTYLHPFFVDIRYTRTRHTAYSVELQTAQSASKQSIHCRRSTTSGATMSSTTAALRAGSWSAISTVRCVMLFSSVRGIVARVRRSLVLLGIWCSHCLMVRYLAAKCQKLIKERKKERKKALCDRL